MNERPPTQETGPENKDQLAQAQDKPNISALQREYELAWTQDDDANGRLVSVERVRYARWLGQSWDGLKHQDELEKLDLEARPYDGAPDTRIFLADGIINDLVDVFYAGFWNARLKVTPTTARTLNAAEAAELRAIINWLKYGPLCSALVMDVERAAQVMCTVGWCVAHPTWRQQAQIRRQVVTSETVAQAVAKLDPQSAMAKLPVLIKDPATQEAAVELVRMVLPDLDAKEAGRMVRELREKDQTEYETVERSNVGPEIGILCPWYHFVAPLEASANPKYGRLGFVRELIPEWAIEERASAEGWDQEGFKEALLKTKGMTLAPGTSVEEVLDENEMFCEVVYAFAWQVNEAGAPGVYCTVFSPHVTEVAPKAESKRVQGKIYGKHWLLDLGHKHRPFVDFLMEVTGWRPNDSRGVPDICATKQMEIKQQRDALFINSQLSNTPPLVKQGTAASKLPPEFGPFAIVNASGGNPWTPLLLTQGSKPELAFKLYELVQKEAEDYYGIPRADTPPGRSQGRLQRYVMRWLAGWSEIFWQLSVLAYQRMTKEELTQILGRAPLLTADLIARHQLMLWWDVRTMDPEWMEKLLKLVAEIAQMDTGGTIDHNKYVSLALAFLDPGIAEELTTDQEGAKQKVFRETRDEVNNIALGNKPLLTEKDPTAKMKQGFVGQILQGNPAFQKLLLPKLANGADNPEHDPERAKNLDTFLKNLQHSYQETVLSKVQGRLGVADVGQQANG